MPFQTFMVRTYSLPSNALPIIAFGWYCILWSVGIIGCVTARRRYRHRTQSGHPLDESTAGVSIIRPLKGLDPNLYENLESTFKQTYPKFEVLLSVADSNDQALDVVRRLLHDFPDVDAKIVIGNDNVGINPKVNNLVRPYKLAKYDILWVLDSNALVAPETLSHSVASMLRDSKRRIGLVHHVPFAKCFATGTEHALGSRLEEAFLNTNHAKMYLGINTVAIESCVVGKSNMFRRSDIDRLDGSLKPSRAKNETPQKTGLEVFARFLAEDNAIAASLWHELDLRHELSNDVVGNVVGHMSFSAYIWRRVRWIRVRKHMVLAATLVEPLTECFMVSALGIWALQRLFDVPVWTSCLLHYSAWIWVDLDVYQSLAGHALPPARWSSFFFAWFLREILAFPIWALAVCGNDVEWRGERYRVARNGEALRAGDS